MREQVWERRLRRVFEGQQGEGPLELLQDLRLFFSSLGQLLGRELQSLLHPTVPYQLDQLLLLEEGINKSFTFRKILIYENI